MTMQFESIEEVSEFVEKYFCIQKDCPALKNNSDVNCHDCMTLEIKKGGLIKKSELEKAKEAYYKLFDGRGTYKNDNEAVADIYIRKLEAELDKIKAYHQKFD